MTIDRRVVTAVEQAVEEAGESPALAQKIVAWLESVASGNTRLSDRDSTDRHLELLFQQVSESTEEYE
jgi:hypothetical protein